MYISGTVFTFVILWLIFISYDYLSGQNMIKNYLNGAYNSFIQYQAEQTNKPQQEEKSSFPFYLIPLWLLPIYIAIARRR